MPPSHAGRTIVPPKAVVKVSESRLKKKKHGGHEEGGGERWLLTYADMITLLLALFIILFAISTPNKVKYAQLARAMSGGFGGTSAINVPTQGSAGASQVVGTSASKTPAKMKSDAAAQPQKTKSTTESKAKSTTQSLEKSVKNIVKRNGAEQKVHVHMEARGLVITLLSDSANYSSGSAELRPQTLTLLHQISGFLNHITNDIRVEGNTDNIPIATAEYPSNWELSSARAVVVTRFLIEQEHVDGRRLSAVGHGPYKPAVDNSTEAHRQLNRRVDIVVMNTRPS